MAEIPAEQFWLYALLYGLFYMPTLSLTNSLAFAHLPDRERDFGKVRLWGTLGWIAVGLAMGHWLASQHTPVDASARTSSPRPRARATRSVSRGSSVP